MWLSSWRYRNGRLCFPVYFFLYLMNSVPQTERIPNISQVVIDCSCTELFISPCFHYQT